MLLEMSHPFAQMPPLEFVNARRILPVGSPTHKKVTVVFERNPSGSTAILLHPFELLSPPITSPSLAKALKVRKPIFEAHFPYHEYTLFPPAFTASSTTLS